MNQQPQLNRFNPSLESQPLDIIQKTRSVYYNTQAIIFLVVLFFICIICFFVSRSIITTLKNSSVINATVLTSTCGTKYINGKFKKTCTSTVSYTIDKTEYKNIFESSYPLSNTVSILYMNSNPSISELKTAKNSYAFAYLIVIIPVLLFILILYSYINGIGFTNINSGNTKFVFDIR